MTTTPPKPLTLVNNSGTAATLFGNDALALSLLSGVAGFVDTAGCLTLFGLLTAHVTGDLVTAGVLAAEHPKLGATARLAMIPIFIVTVAATALFVRRKRGRGAATLAPLLALMTSALALFCATGVALQRFAMTPDAWAVGLIGGTGVIAMAIQNTLMRGALSGYCPTTIMTGNLTQVVIDLVDIVVPAPLSDLELRRQVRSEATARLVKYGSPLAGFMAGAALGAVLTRAVGLLSIALPTVVVGALTTIAWSAARRSNLALPECVESCEEDLPETWRPSLRDSTTRIVAAQGLDEGGEEQGQDRRESSVRLVAARSGDGNAESPPSSRRGSGGAASR